MTRHHHHRAKAPAEFVEQVRAEYESGKTPTQLAREHGLSVNTVNDWVYYRTRNWTDLEKR